MGPYLAGSLFFPDSNCKAKRNGAAAVALIAACLPFVGCGAYPTQEGMFRPISVENSSASISVAAASGPGRIGRNAEAATAPAPRSAHQAASVSQPGIASAALTASREPEADVSKVRGNLGVDQNSLSRLRGRFAPLVPNGITCVSSSMTGAGQDSCTVSLNGISSAGVVVGLTSNNASVSVPSSITVAKNAASATFTANVAAVTASASATITASANGGSATTHLQLNAPAPTLSGLSCTNSSMTGAGSDACSVTLSAAAPSAGVVVNLSSNSAAVTVPATVTVPANSTTAGFTAKVAAVTSAQTATLTATAGASATFSLRLSAPSQATLAVNATSISFGNVIVNEPATQSVVMSSVGTAAVTVNSAAATGTGFSVSGVKFPITLSPGQTATLSVQFAPSTSGSSSGQLTITSNSSSGPTTTVSLTGTGQSYNVQLAWNAPSGASDPIAGYRVYRALAGSASYQLLNSSLAKLTNYVDGTVKNDASYQYYVTTVDSAGAESVPSNTASVSVP